MKVTVISDKLIVYTSETDSRSWQINVIVYTSETDGQS